MYLYNIGYSSYEESDYLQIWHKDKFTDTQLLNIVIDCLWEAIDKDPDLREHCLEKGPTFSGMMSWCGAAAPFFQALLSRGFSRAKFTAQTSLSGWDSAIKPEEDDQGDPETQLAQEELRRRFDAAGYTIEECERKRGKRTWTHHRLAEKPHIESL